LRRDLQRQACRVSGESRRISAACRSVRSGGPAMLARDALTELEPIFLLKLLPLLEHLPKVCQLAVKVCRFLLARC